MLLTVLSLFYRLVLSHLPPSALPPLAFVAPRSSVQPPVNPPPRSLPPALPDYIWPSHFSGPLRYPLQRQAHISLILPVPLPRTHPLRHRRPRSRHPRPSPYPSHARIYRPPRHLPLHHRGLALPTRRPDRGRPSYLRAADGVVPASPAMGQHPVGLPPRSPHRSAGHEQEEERAGTSEGGRTAGRRERGHAGRRRGPQLGRIAGRVVEGGGWMVGGGEGGVE